MKRPVEMMRPLGMLSGVTHKALGAVATINGAVTTLRFVGLTLVVSLQVLSRFALHIPFIWSEEVARFLFFWVALLGAAMSVKGRRHFVLDVSGKGKRTGPDVRLPDLVPDACVRAFSLLLLVEGIGYTSVGLLRTAPNSQINMGAVYAAIPVFAALSVLVSFVVGGWLMLWLLFGSFAILCLAAASLWGWILAFYSVPQTVVGALGDAGLLASSGSVFVVVIVTFLLVGTVMDAIPAIIILQPIVGEIGAAVGIDPYQMGIVVVLTLAIGLITPP